MFHISRKYDIVIKMFLSLLNNLGEIDGHLLEQKSLAALFYSKRDLNKLK